MFGESREIYEKEMVDLDPNYVKAKEESLFDNAVAEKMIKKELELR